MTGAEIILAAREDFLDDAVAPFLWSDTLLERYLNLSEAEACRRASLLLDDTTANDSEGTPLPLCSLTVVAGTSSYVISKKILRILTCVPASTSRPIEKKTEDWLDEFYTTWRSAEGDPVYFLEKKGRITLVPQPVTNDTMQLSIVRLPLASMTIAGDESPEIPEEFHMDLIDYMAHLAYLKQDSETRDIEKSNMYEEQVTQKFGPKLSAITESNRRRKPRNKSLRPKEFGFS